MKELEKENRAQGQDDYKKCLTKNAFGRKKQELVDRLTMECKELGMSFYFVVWSKLSEETGLTHDGLYKGTVFTLANTIMHQHSPNQNLTEQYHLCCWDRGLDPENSGRGLLPEGYRSLGPRPSAINDFVVSAAETLSKAGSIVKVILF